MLYHCAGTSFLHKGLPCLAQSTIVVSFMAAHAPCMQLCYVQLLQQVLFYSLTSQSSFIKQGPPGVSTSLSECVLLGSCPFRFKHSPSPPTLLLATWQLHITVGATISLHQVQQFCLSFCYAMLPIGHWTIAIHFKLLFCRHHRHSAMARPQLVSTGEPCFCTCLHPSCLTVVF